MYMKGMAVMPIDEFEFVHLSGIFFCYKVLDKLSFKILVFYDNCYTSCD